MKPQRTLWHCAVLGVVAILLAGCGGKPSQVSGTVTLDGKTIERGMVGFTPANGGMRASGVIESDGTYTLTTNRDSGLEPGEYMVTVVSREPGPPATTGPPAPGPYITPQHYAAEATSGLKFTVERGSNTIDLELTAAGAPAAAGRK
jgi:hypothetical protein